MMGWRLAVCWLCILGMSFPVASFLPVNLMQQFRTQSEEEVETEHGSAEGMEERRSAPPPPPRRFSATRRWSARLSLHHRATGDRSEFRSLNGTGARLRC